MENTESTELPMERLEQLITELRGKAECGETLKQLVSGIEQLMSTITVKPNKDLGTSTSAEAEDDEYATVYFRVCLSGDWFAIPPRGAQAMYSVIEEPQYSFSSRVVPLALGYYLVLIIMEDEALDLDKHKHRDGNGMLRLLRYQNTHVYYLDVLDTDAGWKRAAPSFIGYVRCFYFAANNKIYRLECSKDHIFFLQYLDFGCLDKGWQPQTLNEPPTFLPSNDSTLMLEYKEGDTALIFFMYNICFTYNLNTSAFCEYEVPNYDTVSGSCYCTPVSVGNTMYMVCENQRSFNLMAYSHLNQKWCPTPVIGLDENVFPFYYPDDLYVPARLLHLGKQRLCLLWPFTTGLTTRVYCTKFDVSEDKEKHYAKVVFNQVYKIKSYGGLNFKAISIRK